MSGFTVYFATDLHGSERCFRKFINAGRFYAKDQLLAEFDYPIIGVVTRLDRADDVFQMRRAYSLMATSLGILLCGYIGVLVVFDAAFRGVLRDLL